MGLSCAKEIVQKKSFAIKAQCTIVTDRQTGHETVTSIIGEIACQRRRL